VPFVEHEVEDVQDGLEAVVGRGRGGEYGAGFANLGLGPADALRDGRLGDEVGERDLGGRQPDDCAQGECDLGGRGESGMAAELEDLETVVMC
jgi:hypothetical protein